MTIAIIGTGNMGGAIMRGLVQSGTCRPEEFICTAKTEATLAKLRGYHPCLRTSKDNAFSVAEADLVVLAVKPWLVEAVMEEIRPVLRPNRHILVSVAAGVTLHQLSEMSGQGVPVFRAIPNTAVEALCGVTVMAHHGASAEQVSQVQDLFSVLGYALIVEEKLVPAATSLTSCGIAFAMRYIRAAMEGGVELGFRPDEAARLVEHTVKGAATLLLQNGAHPEVEIDKVTTAGGITIKGLNAMERSGFTSAVVDGLKASLQ